MLPVPRGLRGVISPRDRRAARGRAAPVRSPRARIAARRRGPERRVLGARRANPPTLLTTASAWHARAAHPFRLARASLLRPARGPNRRLPAAPRPAQSRARRARPRAARGLRTTPRAPRKSLSKHVKFQAFTLPYRESTRASTKALGTTPGAGARLSEVGGIGIISF